MLIDLQSERSRATLVSAQGRDPVVWEDEAAVSYRKAWAHPTNYGAYKDRLAIAYKRCRAVSRELRGSQNKA